MSDTSDDDAMLAAAEAEAHESVLETGCDACLATSAVATIARRLQGENADLAARLFKFQNDDRHSYRGKALQQAEIIMELSLKNAALTERLRVAEERNSLADRVLAAAAVAIARRLQDEVAAHARCHRDTERHIDQLEAEVRELQEQLNECPNCRARYGAHLYGCQAR